MSGARSSGRLNFVSWHPIFVGPEYELATCHLSGAYNFQVAPRFLEFFFYGPRDRWQAVVNAVMDFWFP